LIKGLRQLLDFTVAAIIIVVVVAVTPADLTPAPDHPEKYKKSYINNNIYLAILVILLIGIHSHTSDSIHLHLAGNLLIDDETGLHVVLVRTIEDFIELLGCDPDGSVVVDQEPVHFFVYAAINVADIFPD
jgi:hypothetical protein